MGNLAQKTLIVFLTLVVSVATGPGLALANGGGTDSETVNTDLQRGDGGGNNPVVKAKWEMLPWDSDGGFANSRFSSDIADHKPDTTGAQFLPTGQWGDRTVDGDQGERDYEVCGIVEDPDGLSDIDRVFTDVYYPDDVAYHPAPGTDKTLGGEEAGATKPSKDTTNTVLGESRDVSGDGSSEGYDYGENACGVQVGDENELDRLGKQEGRELFCDVIRNHNENLPSIYEGHDWGSICGDTGQLAKEEAAVYCADKSLEWEDPAGQYRVEVLAQDKAGQVSWTESNRDSAHLSNDNSANDPINGPDEWDSGEINFNFFDYLPLTAFETDFSSVDYGSVKLNTHKRISGDKTFDTGDGLPTVRNTGNTRLYMGVEQDDMGLGTTDGQWNVQYDARVGSNENHWRYYQPDEHQWLEDIVDLSEEEEMDFSVEIYKFPDTDANWGGEMTLDAKPAPFRQCTENTTNI